jgi:hypothetical protein
MYIGNDKRLWNKQIIILLERYSNKWGHGKKKKKKKKTITSVYNILN